MTDRASERPDDDAVLDAAAALDVTEFEVFRLAARRWPGGTPERTAIERDFARYMFHGEAPRYVLWFCRRVLDDARAGSLHPAAYGATAPKPATGARFGGLYVGATLLFVVGFMAVIMSTPDPYGVDFPCSAGQGMAAVERMAQTFTGRSAPLGCGQNPDEMR